MRCLRAVCLAATGMACMIGLFAVVGGCASDPPSPLRVATNIWPGYEPLYLARELGYLDLGSVQLYEMPSSSAVITAFRNRSVDAAGLTLDEVLLLAQDDLDIRVILVMDISNGGDVLLARPGIATLSDLRGKRVGAENEALGAYMLSRALDQAGLVPGDIALVPLTADVHEQAYKTGQVDAVVTFEPVRTRLLSAGAVTLFDSSKIPNEIFDVFVVHAEALQAHPRQLEKLRSSWFSALEYLRSNPEDACARMAKRQRVSGPEFQESLKGMIIPDRAQNEELLTGREPGLLAPTQRLISVMLRYNLIRRALDPTILLRGLPESNEAGG